MEEFVRTGSRRRKKKKQAARTQFVRLVTGQMRNARPGLLRRCAEQLEDLVQLIVGVPNARERRHAGDHLDENAANAPHVQRRGVVGAAEQNV